jgi:hypothetical protein
MGVGTLPRISIRQLGQRKFRRVDICFILLNWTPEEG